MPYLQPNQAQKHVTLNESLAALDAPTGLLVRSRIEGTQPASPEDGDTYILPTDATGALWADWEAGSLATWRESTWCNLPATGGLKAWVEDEALLLVHTGSAWEAVSPTAVPKLGVNADADATNRLAVKSDAVLLSHDDATPGSGDLRQFLNRAGAGNVAALIFATDDTAGTEIGLTGSDDLTLRTSPDDIIFSTGLHLQAADSAASFPSGFADPDTVLSDLAFRFGLGTISDGAIATLDYGEPVYGAAVLAVPNSLSSGPMVFFYARMASGPTLQTVFSSGASFSVTTGELTGTTGADGSTNFSVTDDGRLIVENRRGYAVANTLFVFRR